MPMTARQLKGVGEDYADFLPTPGEVVACEEASPSRKSTCDICGEPFLREYKWIDDKGFERIDWSLRAAKQIVVTVQGRMIRHYRLLVCRQGVKCRSVRSNEIVMDKVVSRLNDSTQREPHVVPYAAAR